MKDYTAPALTVLKAAAGVTASVAVAMAPAVIQILVGAH